MQYLSLAFYLNILNTQQSFEEFQCLTFKGSRGQDAHTAAAGRVFYSFLFNINHRLTLLSSSEV